MFDISSTKVNKFIVHHVGNKLRNEGIRLSSREATRSNALDELLLKGFLAPVVRQGQHYELFHESDIKLNTVSHYANEVFSTNESFLSSSEAISKHLYSHSTHPNIGGGEFLIILFDDIRLNNTPEQALGLFRIESMNDYLDVNEDPNGIELIERSGISLDKVQKGAIIFSSSLNVIVLDSLSQKTKYWNENFLKATPSQTPKASAKAVGSMLKTISSKVASPNDALEFGTRLSDKLSESDGLTVSSVREISYDFINSNEVDELFNSAQLKHGFPLKDDTRLESKSMSRYVKGVVKKAHISEGVSLLISKDNTKVKSIDVKRTKSGFKAIVDIETAGG